MIIRLVISLLVLFPLLAQAQYISRLGRFSVDERKGCTPLTVTITNTNLITTGFCTGGNPCDIDWGDNSTPQQNIFVHTYTQPGTYLLRVLYQNLGIDDIQIVVTPNTPPAFDVYTCGGNQVQVRVTDTNYDAYIINFNDGSPEVQVPKGAAAVSNHTYATSGNKTISVRGKDVNADDNCGSNTLPVNALAVLPPPFINELTVINSTSIALNYTAAPNILYRLEVATNNNTAFQLAQTLYNASTTSLTNLRPDDNYYCFRLGAFDPCNNTTVYSNIICSADLNAVAQNNQNNLTWATNATGISNFSINRDGLPAGTTATSSFIDNNVVCKTEYCYQLTSNYTNGSRSISLVKCVTAFSTDIPTAINNATAQVTATGLDLTWPQDPAFQPIDYSVLRKPGSGNFQLIGKPTLAQYFDNAYTTLDEFCYRVNYVDVCGNSAPQGIEICPIRLTGNLTPENYSSLSWSGYEGWLNGVNQYILEKYNLQGQLLQTIPLGAGTLTYLDSDVNPNEQVYRYIVRANANQAGLGQAVSNEIELKKEPKLFYPTAFTPDKQGPVQNEEFRVFGQYIARFEMQIFNRWGELLFSTSDIDVGWDGTFRGKDQPEGTYAFVARLTDLSGTSFTRSGSVVLLRKR
ncbi:MAG: gliding motility-associated C-terminal domain-containing protein [Cyclobacteriaceae bacterium]|nr:gliding motility-associated C-terminal domain-containing protein [Cyclobacteriaceae bacterium]UYN88011.1 MAG: gliding motility-associated C-terminal domain-containing protein [Cyclobacteriaceae bacterium]